MKKVLLGLSCMMVALNVAAQEKGRFEVYDMDNFKLHVYYTNDALGDASYIIEGDSVVVTMEQPLFKDNVAEFDAYLARLGKPVEQRIADYHIGGTGDSDLVMAEGMPEFTKGEVYGGMMAGFAKAFGDAIAPLPTGKASEVAFGSKQTYAGVEFRFNRGAATDFPGASILIGGKVYFTHWAPQKAHVNHLQVSSMAAIDAEIAEARRALQSGAKLFIGGHGGAADVEAVRFKIGYLQTLKKLRDANPDADSFVEAVKRSYPGLPGEAGLPDLAKALY